MRSLDIVLEEQLRSGRLVAVLSDWRATNAPSVRLVPRPAVMRLPRVRAAVEFLQETFADIERRCMALAGARTQPTAPAWAPSARFKQASVAAGRTRTRGDLKR